MFMAINRYTNKYAERLCGLYEDLKSLPGMVPRATYPIPIACPAQSAAVTIPWLEFFKLDRMNGTPLAEIDEGNRRHGIYLARMPGVVFAGNNPARIILTKHDEAAHCLLVDHGPPLAQALHCCAHAIGGLYMVIIEHTLNAKGLHRFFLPL